MGHEETTSVKEYPAFVSKLRDYALIMKPNVSFLVVFSSIMGFALVPESLIATNISFSFANIVYLFLGGMLVTNGANTINQILERNSDRYMIRTSIRPLPGGRMNLVEAWSIVVLLTISGALILGIYFNWLAAGISLVSLILYGFIYTPLKKIHPIATFVGAIPGALPPLIGWVAATNSFAPEIVAGGIVLFLIQLIWQFPHVWAVAWMHYDDYKNAGIILLPSKQGKTKSAGLQSFFYSLCLIPLSMAPWQMGISGWVSMMICVICGMALTFNAYLFYQQHNDKAAKRLFYTSLFYLPIVLMALVLDKM